MLHANCKSEISCGLCICTCVALLAVAASLSTTSTFSSLKLSANIGRCSWDPEVRHELAANLNFSEDNGVQRNKGSAIATGKTLMSTQAGRHGPCAAIYLVSVTCDFLDPHRGTHYKISCAPRLSNKLNAIRDRAVTCKTSLHPREQAKALRGLMKKHMLTRRSQ